MNEIEKIPLSKEMKILFLQILKQGEISKENADVLIDYMQTGELIQRVQIVFKNFNVDER